MKTSEKISLRRRILNITQEDLSKKIGVSSKTIGRWESSERSPSGDVLIKLASALDTTVSYLLGETDTPTESNAHEITDIIWVPVVSDRVKVCAGNGNAYPGITVRYAMQLTALTFVRSAELRHVVWYGLNWSFELNDQGRCRLHRQGSEFDTVYVHHLVIQDSVDENVMESVRGKGTVHNSVMDALKARMKKIKGEMG